MTLLASTPIPSRPMVWGFSLFTNDDPRGVAALDAAVRASLDRIGPRSCAVWATIARPKLAGVSYTNANRQLYALAADPALAGRLQIVPWAEAVAEHREWLRKDRVHPTQEGYAARAQLFADAALRCNLS
jgi:lysophospholipase L1-like esterase